MDAVAKTQGTLSKQDLLSWICGKIDIAADEIDDCANLLGMGLDSIDIMHWLHAFRDHGYDVGMVDLYRDPTVRGWTRLLKRSPVRALQGTENESRAWPTADEGSAYPLTPVQHAYLVGRSPQQPLGGVGCHLYQEFDGESIDIAALEAAIRHVLLRHPLLRTAFAADGTQRCLAVPTWAGLAIHRLEDMSDDGQHGALKDLRDRLSHRLMPVETAGCIDFQIALLGRNGYRLFSNVDLLVADAASYATILDEIVTLFSGGKLVPVDGRYDFRSYLAQREAASAHKRQKAERYWKERQAFLPAAPDLPLAGDHASIASVRITRRSFAFPSEIWRSFREQSSAHGLTPTMVLATCYAATLSRWSSQERLLLNLTLFDRHPIHPAVSEMVADFTNVILLDTTAQGATIAEMARINQDMFAEAYEYHDLSGVHVLRELRRQGSHPNGAPIVFTSNLGRPLISHRAEAGLGKRGWGISQTPQVWIDHMAIQHGDEVILQWDSNDALFPEALPQSLFDAYVGLVKLLASDPAAWDAPVPDLMPPAQREIRRAVNATATSLPDGLLHADVFEQAERRPDALAIAHGDQQWSYRDLSILARCISAALQKRGVTDGAYVGICLRRGGAQIAAVLGTLHAGAIYVPIDSHQPAGRIDRICENAALSLLIVCEDDARHLEYAPAIDRLVWQSVQDQAPAGSPASIDPDRAAYVIYTSGSTGVPKGVVVTHRSALNTCRDITRRYGIGEGDRLLALSALHFDLSVYDIFGILGAGGALVLVDETQRRDPAVWCDRIERYGITVWNTVPALFDMLLTYAEGCDLEAPARLRLVLLSGDWISLTLPGRFRAFRRDGQFVAMGGATEAAIWSNALDVFEVPSEWRSIPYGFPLANQRYRVVDTGGRDCPDWVAGELWIGGAGVARGYHRDTERTEAQFAETATGRWYRTGDMGRYWPDGTLEFLGRRDKQVKIGGYRVELGEIDAAFGRIDGVKAAVTLAIGDREKSLTAFAVLQPGAFDLDIPANPALPASYAKLIGSPRNASTEVIPDEMVAEFLLDHLARHGVAFDRAPTVDEVIHDYGCAPGMAAVLRAWVDWLADGGRLQVDGSGRYRVSDNAERPLNAQGADRQMTGALLAHHPTVERILRGDLPATALLEHPFWSPEHVALRLSGSREGLEALTRIIVELHRRLDRAPRVVELGSRSGVAANRLLDMLAGAPVDYLGLDASPDMVIRARDRLAQYPSARIERWVTGTIRAHAHQADIVWANNSLHRHPIPAEAIRDMTTLAAPGGLLFVQEPVRLPSEALVSTTLLTLDEPSSLRSPTDWCGLFAASGASCDCVMSDGLVAAIALRVPSPAVVIDEARLQAELRQQLPDYMIPRRIQFLDSLPLTANGKIDARALTESAGTSVSEMRASDPPVGEAEQLLASLWCQMLECPSVDRNSDFFKLGGDSLLATRLIGALQSRGYRADLGDIFAYPRLAAFAGTLRPCGDAVERQLEHDSASRHLPFPLTDLQQAYLVGREPGFALGGVGSHFFVQFEVGHLDLDRFQAAWNAMIAAHDMLRAVVNEGRQLVLPTVPFFTIQRHRVVSLKSVAAERLRDRLSREVRDPGCWPWFAVHVVQDDSDLSHVMVSLDNLFVDGMSMQMLFGELKLRYLDPGKQICGPEITFRDYVVSQIKKEIAPRALEYWRSRIPSLPAAPNLPLRCLPETIKDVRFVRMEDHLPAPDWQALRESARRHGLTPSALLLAGYAAIISAWSDKPAVTINLTLFDRRPVHTAIEDVLGDFTTLMLLAWHPEADWLGSARQMQDRLRQDLPHRDVSAIRVLREMARLHNVPAVAMPVVFTSAIGYDRDEGFLSRRSWLKPVWGISQTPQAWLDNQVYEADGCLYFNWDAVEALFEPDVLRAMFDQYATLLRQLARDPASWALALRNLVPRAAPDRQKYSASSSPPCLPRLTPDRAPADATVLRDLHALIGRVIGDAIGEHQNFFDAGATSLNLVQLHAMLRQQGYRDLSVTDMFVHTTPAALANLLSSHCGSRPSVADDSASVSPVLELRERRRLNRAEIRKQPVAQPSSHD